MARRYAMQLDAIGTPLRAVDRTVPVPGPGELVLEVVACGVCRTDLHVVDGEVPARLPIVPGHEIVGRVVALGAEVEGISIGQRLGVPWLGGTCGICRYCRSGRENLCDRPVFTGATRDGGYATHAVADARYCLPLPDAIGDAEAAPLLCAGLIGHRALVMAGEADRIALYGFGAAAHIVAQVARWQGREVYAVTRPGDVSTQAFARSLGCSWAGGSDEALPAEIDAAILFAPAGELVPLALRQVRKGGRVVCAGIHMSDIPSFPYADLWGERAILSVANLTRADGRAFLEIAPKVPIRTSVTRFPLHRANDALAAVRAGRIEGAAVLVPERRSAQPIRDVADSNSGKRPASWVANLEGNPLMPSAMLATSPNADLRDRAHDLRNLFGAIASARHLLDDGLDEPRRTQVLDAIEEAARRGGALTTSLLDSAAEGRVRRLDLRERLERLEPLLRTVAGADNHVIVDPGDTAAVIRAAPERFDHVVIELVANARHALTQPGTIRVRLRTGRGVVRLLVADTGRGMTGEACKALLTRGPTFGANGTGFQQVRRFVRDAHGRLGLRSSPGRGTWVALELPALLALRS